MGCGAQPHQARAPILSLLRTVFSGSWSLPCLAPQRIRNIAEANAAAGGLVRKGSPREQQVRSGRLLPDFQGSRFSSDTPKEFRARVRARGWGAGKLFKAPPGGSSLLLDSHPPRIHYVNPFSIVWGDLGGHFAGPTSFQGRRRPHGIQAPLPSIQPRPARRLVPASRGQRAEQRRASPACSRGDRCPPPPDTPGQGFRGRSAPL